MQSGGPVINHWWFGLLCIVIYVPLCWVRKIEVFNKTHLFADIIIVVMIVSVIVYGCIYAADPKHHATGF